MLYTVDVREPKPTKLLVQKDPAPISGGGNGANSISTGKTIPVYTVNSNPLNDNMIATAGRDPHVRVYDRRFASEENNQPIKNVHRSASPRVRSCTLFCLVYFQLSFEHTTH